MTVVAASTVEGTAATLGGAATVLLHLVPGVVALLGFVVLLPLVGAAGLPSTAALAGSGLVVVPAVQLGALAAHRRRRPAESAVLLRAHYHFLACSDGRCWRSPWPASRSP